MVVPLPPPLPLLPTTAFPAFLRKHGGREEDSNHPPRLSPFPHQCKTAPHRFVPHRNSNSRLPGSVGRDTSTAQDHDCSSRIKLRVGRIGRSQALRDAGQRVLLDDPRTSPGDPHLRRILRSFILVGIFSGLPFRGHTGGQVVLLCSRSR